MKAQCQVVCSSSLCTTRAGNTGWHRLRTDTEGRAQSVLLGKYECGKAEGKVCMPSILGLLPCRPTKGSRGLRSKSGCNAGMLSTLSQ